VLTKSDLVVGASAAPAPTENNAAPYTKAATYAMDDAALQSFLLLECPPGRPKGTPRPLGGTANGVSVGAGHLAPCRPKGTPRPSGGSDRRGAWGAVHYSEHRSDLKLEILDPVSGVFLQTATRS
jgi:hypothetical protein